MYLISLKYIRRKMIIVEKDNVVYMDVSDRCRKFIHIPVVLSTQ